MKINRCSLIILLICLQLSACLIAHSHEVNPDTYVVSSYSNKIDIPEQEIELTFQNIKIPVTFIETKNYEIILEITDFNYKFLKSQALKAKINLDEFIVVEDTPLMTIKYKIPFCTFKSIENKLNTYYIVFKDDRVEMQLKFDGYNTEERKQIKVSMLAVSGRLYSKDIWSPIKCLYTINDSKEIQCELNVESSELDSTEAKLLEISKKNHALVYSKGGIGKGNITVKLLLEYIDHIINGPEEKLNGVAFKYKEKLIILSIPKFALINLLKDYSALIKSTIPNFKPTYIEVTKKKSGNIINKFEFFAYYRAKNLVDNIFGYEFIIYETDFMERVTRVAPTKIISDNENSYSLKSICEAMKAIDWIKEDSANYYIPFSSMKESGLNIIDLTEKVSQVTLNLQDKMDLIYEYDIKFDILADYKTEFSKIQAINKDFNEILSKNLQSGQLICIDSQKGKCLIEIDEGLCLNKDLGSKLEEFIHVHYGDQKANNEKPIVLFLNNLCLKYSVELNDKALEYQNFLNEKANGSTLSIAMFDLLTEGFEIEETY